MPIIVRLTQALGPLKSFKLSASQIHPIAQGWGACIASDRITVDGRPVGYCYREAPNNDLDSGWVFLAGDEDQQYMDDSENHSLYDVNTIVNYDPAILAILATPAPCAFERDTANSLVPILD